MKIKELKPNPRNPRKMSAEKKADLKASVEKFGDLGCICYNRTTKNLISGHQRISVMSKNAVIKIESKFSPKTNTMTVAEGYIEDNGERFKYREVEAPIEWEMEALLAANGHSGDWDDEKVRVLFKEFPKLNIKMTGLQLPMLKIMGVDLSQRPAALLDAKKPEAGSADDLEEDDDDYVANTETTEEQIDTEKIPSDKAFEKVEEKTDVVGKRFVLIIDCPNGETKESLKEKIRPLVEEASSKFF